MFRLLLVPILIGISAFVFIFFVVPLLFSESGFVAFFAELALESSNSLFASMPPAIADIITSLDLLKLALAIALLITIAIQLLVLIGDACGFVAKAVMAIFKRSPKPAGPKDLPSLDLDAGRLQSRPGNRILGGGFDSVDPD